MKQNPIMAFLMWINRRSKLQLGMALFAAAVFAAPSIGLAQGGSVIAWGSNYYGSTNVPAGLTNVVAISANENFNLALTASGAVVPWGSTETSRHILPAGLTNVTAIAVGGGHAIALRSNGTVVSWGGATTNVPSDVTNVVAISAGGYSLALKSDGTIKAWGAGDFGQTNVPPGLSDVIAIAAGYLHGLALKGDGTVVGWGHSGFGSVVPSGLNNITAIAAGARHSLALKSDTTVVAWGSNEEGQLNVPPGLSNVVAIAGGYGHSLALKSDGTLVPWGSTAYGEANIPVGLSNVVAIASGWRHNAALTGDGTLKIISQPANQVTFSGKTAQMHVLAVGVPPLNYQWFFNGSDIPGATNGTLRLANLQLTNAGSYQVIVCDATRCATSSMATLTVSDSAPFIVAQPSSQISYLGASTQFQVQADGSHPLIYQWRFNGVDLAGETNSVLSLENLLFEHVGNYSVTVTNSFGATVSSNAFLSVNNIVQWYGSGTIAAVPSGLSNVVAIAAGGAALALNEDGTVVAWVNHATAYLPPGLTNITALAAGAYHALALKADGLVVAWGFNGSAETNVPPDLTNVVAIAAAESRSLALISGGTVRAWGVETNVPTGLSSVVAISAGELHSLALKADGTVIAWGGSSNVPPNVTNIVAIAAGGLNESFALKADGTVVWWSDGQIQAINIPGLTNIVAISVKNDRYADYHLALRADGAILHWVPAGVFTANLPPGLTNVIGLAIGESNVALIGKPNPEFLRPPEIRNNAMTLFWRSIPGRRYRVQFTTDPGSGWTDVSPDAYANASVASFTESVTGQSHRFYRVRLLP